MGNQSLFTGISNSLKASFQNNCEWKKVLQMICDESFSSRNGNCDNGNYDDD